MTVKSVSDIIATIGRIPYMSEEQAEAMTRHIVEHRLARALELGFYHGASTCFIANAVSGFAGAEVVCVDRERARTMVPNVESLLERLALRDIVTVHYEPNSYLWRLMKLIEANPAPCFDLCYLDGAHNWFVDGFAFFLVDRLLKPGGWLIMDDLNWRYADSSAMKGSERLAQMPTEEVDCYQLRKVYELLVQRQPGYGNFREEYNWGYAQKLSDGGGRADVARIETKVVVKEQHVGFGAALVKLGRRLGLR